MRSRSLVTILLSSQLSVAGANRVPGNKLLDQMIHRSMLAEAGGKPFYLNATITDKDDAKSEFNGTVEEFWVSPNEMTPRHQAPRLFADANCQRRHDLRRQ